MKVRLPDALHARPANLLVRLAAQHDAVGLSAQGRVSGRRAQDPRGALARGGEGGRDRDLAEGAGAAGAIEALVELVARASTAIWSPSGERGGRGDCDWARARGDGSGAGGRRGRTGRGILEEPGARLGKRSARGWPGPRRARSRSSTR